MSPIELTLPMPPNLANRPMHHMVKHRLKLGYWALVDMMFGYPWDIDAIHWVSKYVAKRKIPDLASQMQHALDFATTAKLAPPQIVKRQRFARASIRSTMYLGAAMDDGNAMNRHKWAEDWLTERGFIADDKKKCLTWEGFPEQIIKRDGNYRIVLTISPIISRED